MRDVLLILSGLLALATLAWLVDLARRAFLWCIRLRHFERESAFHQGYLEGFEVGSGTEENLRRIRMRKERFGR